MIDDDAGARRPGSRLQPGRGGFDSRRRLSRRPFTPPRRRARGASGAPAPSTGGRHGAFRTWHPNEAVPVCGRPIGQGAGLLTRRLQVRILPTTRQVVTTLTTNPRCPHGRFSTRPEGVGPPHDRPSLARRRLRPRLGRRPGGAGSAMPVPCGPRIPPPAAGGGRSPMRPDARTILGSPGRGRGAARRPRRRRLKRHPAPPSVIGGGPGPRGPFAPGVFLLRSESTKVPADEVRGGEVAHDAVQACRSPQLRDGPATSATASSAACSRAGTHWFFDPLGRVEVEVVSHAEHAAGARQARPDRPVAAT